MKKTIVLLLAAVSVMFSSCGGNEGLKRTEPLAAESAAADVFCDAQFSEDTMFSLRIYQPWIYESLHFTLKSDGTLIVLYYNDELGREQLSEERMNEIREVFSAEKVYNMDIGREDERTDGTRRYIILYDACGNEIEIGGYELRGGDGFNSYFEKLYRLLEDDYTKQFSDQIDECNQNGITFREKLDKDATGNEDIS